MKTITIAAQKGGAGKTTLALHLATLALEDGTTLLVDIDPQGSLSYWYDRRQVETPLLVQATAKQLPDAIAAAQEESVDWVLIDTAPHDSASMATAIRLADHVLIPARPSALDLHAIEATLNMAHELKKPSTVVLTQTPPRRGFGKPIAVREAIEVVEGMGGQVADTYIVHRGVAATSVLVGLSVGELEPNGPSAKEFANLWREIKTRI